MWKVCEEERGEGRDRRRRETEEKGKKMEEFWKRKWRRRKKEGQKRCFVMTGSMTLFLSNGSRKTAWLLNLLATSLSTAYLIPPSWISFLCPYDISSPDLSHDSQSSLWSPQPLGLFLKVLFYINPWLQPPVGWGWRFQSLHLQPRSLLMYPWFMYPLAFWTS